MEKFLVLVKLIPLLQKFQRLEGKIEDISCKDLVDLRADLYFLILQKLKEKAIELEKLIDKKSRNTNEWVGGSDSLHCLEKDLIKGRLSCIFNFEQFLCTRFCHIDIASDTIFRSGLREYLSRGRQMGKQHQH